MLAQAAGPAVLRSLHAHAPLGARAGILSRKFSTTSISRVIVGNCNRRGRLERFMTDEASILLVDDDPEILATLANALSERFRLFFAANASEAIQIITDEAIDLLLTDLIMPGMDGVTLAERAVALRPGLRVIYMTGHPYLAKSSRLPRRGTLIAKPFTPSAMIYEVAATLADDVTALRRVNAR
jgi:two-component system cell cycle response regulator CpdR